MNRGRDRGPFRLRSSKSVQDMRATKSFGVAETLMIFVGNILLIPAKSARLRAAFDWGDFKEIPPDIDFD